MSLPGDRGQFYRTGQAANHNQLIRELLAYTPAWGSTSIESCFLYATPSHIKWVTHRMFFVWISVLRGWITVALIGMLAWVWQSSFWFCMSNTEDSLYSICCSDRTKQDLRKFELTRCNKMWAWRRNETQISNTCVCLVWKLCPHPGGRTLAEPPSSCIFVYIYIYWRCRIAS
jgi:hypothetical protein